jgi:uncharacterized protein YdeI (YjbR/CyaY-like superfamily)
MIYNRTATDVSLAKRLRAEKVQKFIELTDDEVQTLERGTITINTLNRIEDKQAEIKAMLDDMGYLNTPVINKTWTLNDIFTADDFQRIIDNNIALRAAFYALRDSPKNAIAKYYYEEFNALEKILFDISCNIEYAVSKYRRCGTFNCGG